LSKNGGREGELSRRAFLGSSVTATVASMALPSMGLPAIASAEIEQNATRVPSGIDFRSAKPIWPQGREKDMNLFVGFRAAFEFSTEERVRLCVTGSTLYRIYLNGEFFAWGPARGPHNHFRVDTWDITHLLVAAKNMVCIEVAGYNVNSYYVLNQPSFIQAEVATDSAVLASTGESGNRFQARIISERVQKVQRYSFQRAFSEVYRLDPNYADWRERVDAKFVAIPCSSSEVRRLIPRRVPHPTYSRRQPEQIACVGSFEWGGGGPRSLADDRSVPFGAKPSPTLLGYPEQEMTEIPYLELQRTKVIENARVDEPYSWDRPQTLRKGKFTIFDFGTNLTGFIGASVIVRNPTKLYITFDETLTDGDVNFTRLMCVNIIAYTLAPGTYSLESFEPYVLRFLKLMVTDGECGVHKIYLREYATPDVWNADFRSSDNGLNELFAAGRETYRANSVDIFMDTPSRERGGWLCDSSFTAQVAPLLSGHTKVEKGFFENFLLPDRFAHIPDGMLPMCYPAEHYDGGFIPNWSLWFIIQLEQYLMRSGDGEMVEAFRPRILKLLEYFKPFQNDDGLLEKLKGWVFVEWSKSNDYVQDVNYPTNMLYAGALASVGRIYNLPQYTNQSEALKKRIRAQSYDGEFFIDNAVRQGASLTPTRNRTETCQYYAFYFDTASPETHPKLWATLQSEFGPPRRTSGKFPDVAPSNAFMGNVMRLELLSRLGLTEQLAIEAKLYFLPMAELTGTFWENMGNEASMNHAFGSHIVTHLYRDILGLYQVDAVRKSVHVRFTSSPVQMCEGRVPTPEGFISMRWAKVGNTLTYQLDLPAGYNSRIDNIGNFTVEQRHFPHGQINYGYKVEGGYK